MMMMMMMMIGARLIYEYSMPEWHAKKALARPPTAESPAWCFGGGTFMEEDEGWTEDSN